MRRASEMEHVSRIVQVGLRGVGSARAADVEDARAAGNLLVTAAELRERGVSAVLGAGCRRTHRSSCRSTATGSIRRSSPRCRRSAPGGLSYAEAFELLGGIGPRLAGAAVTEYVPALDESGASAMVAARLLIRLIAGLG